MSESHAHSIEVAPGVYLPEAALSYSFSRSSGPGGQNVNKVNSRATLDIPISALRRAMPPYAVRRLKTVASRYVTQEGLQISASDSRSQTANRKACLQRLREVLIEAMRRPKVRKATKPSARARQRRLDNKKHRSRIKSLRRGKE